MLWMALTLGFFGSLHCIGMCGPLAIAFCDRPSQSVATKLFYSITYNLGRTLTYSLLGVVFGLIGSMLILASLQKVISIVLGVLFVLSFLMTIDIDNTLNRIGWVNRIYQKVQYTMSNLLNRSKRYPPFLLGVVNGVLPCGLVYLAIAGAMSRGGMFSGALFMMCFGLGTIPAMLGLTMSMQLVSAKRLMGIRRVIPYVTLVFGIFLIYRGIVVDMPAELDFWEALKNPVMCH